MWDLLEESDELIKSALQEYLPKLEHVESKRDQPRCLLGRGRCVEILECICTLKPSMCALQMALINTRKPVRAGAINK